MTKHSGASSKNLSLMVAKNMCHAALVKSGQCEGDIRKAYTNVCFFNASDSFDSGMSKLGSCFLEDSLPPLPGFVLNLEPRGKDDSWYVGIHQKVLVNVSIEHGLKPLREGVYRGVSSFARTPDGYACLLVANQELVVFDGEMNEIERHSPRSLGIVLADDVLLSANDAGFIFTCKKQKIVHFVDFGCTNVRSVSLAHFSLLFRGAGYMGGALVFEWYRGSAEYGELIWVDPSGEIVSLLGGLKSPSSARLFKGGVLVCDMEGIHFLYMSGLAVCRRKFLPWRELMDMAGLNNGFGQEALLTDRSLVVRYNLMAPGVPGSHEFCIARYNLDLNEMDTQ